MLQRNFNGFLRKFHVSFKEVCKAVSEKFQVGSMEVSRPFQGGFKGGFKGGSRKLQG